MPPLSDFPEEVQLYLAKAEEELNSAELLFNNNFYADCVSRAYYAGFHAIAAGLRFLSVDISIHKHAYILKQFATNFVESGIFPEELFSKMITIKQLREQSDYAIQTKMKKSQAQKILKDVRAIIDTIKEMLEQW